MGNARDTLTAVIFSGAIGLAAIRSQAAPLIGAIAKSAESVGRYDKLELTVALGGSYANPFDPDQIDLSAQFTSPSGKPWKVNGFFDGSKWKIRFAANETGAWTYLVTAKDASGSGQGSPGAFVCAGSPSHGWVRVAPNRRYLRYDDGTSFYGIGSCHAWGVSANSLDQMRDLGFNTYVYWNGTYDGNGGGNLIESNASGLGRYDQGKCARIDNLLEMSEARNLTMILVILPHDYASENMGGWPSAWQSNPYKGIVSCGQYYSSASSWAYQQKQYRYIIARWGYSRGLSAWQTVDEISGTCGWKADQAGAEAWTGKIGAFFQANDPFRHPTTASHGDYWDVGNKANDFSNTEVYGNYATANIAATIQKLWNGYAKPAIMGETGADNDGPTAHRKIWAGLAAGIAITPLLWQFNQGWNAAISSQYAPFVKFTAGIDFAALTSPAQAKVTVPGAIGYAIASDQVAFGWITGDISGKMAAMGGLADGNASVQWYDCSTGNLLASTPAVISGGNLSVAVPSTAQTDLAFKIIGPGTGVRPAVSAHSGSGWEPDYADGLLTFGRPGAEKAEMKIISARGRTVFAGTAAGNGRVTVAVGKLESGVYWLESGKTGGKTFNRFLVR